MIQFAVLLALSQPAPPIDCEMVRAYVAQYGKVAALAKALEQGATWAQINQARRCLKAG